MEINGYKFSLPSLQLVIVTIEYTKQMSKVIFWHFLSSLYIIIIIIKADNWITVSNGLHKYIDQGCRPILKNLGF